MSQVVLEILSKIESLSQKERAELAQAFLDSLDPGDALATEAFDAELDARLDQIEAGTAVGRPAAEIFEELRGQR